MAVVLGVENARDHEAGRLMKERSKQPGADPSRQRVFRRRETAVAVEKKRDTGQPAGDDAEHGADRAPPQHEDHHVVVPAEEREDDAGIDVPRPAAIAVVHQVAQKPVAVAGEQLDVPPQRRSHVFIAVILRAGLRKVEHRQVGIRLRGERAEERILILNNVRGHDGDPHARAPMTRAGMPATIAFGGTSFVTTAPAPTIAPSPMVTPGRITDFAPSQTSAPIVTGAERLP